MEEKNKLEQLFFDMKEYAETRFDIAVLNVQDKVAEVLSSMASAIVAVVFLVFIIFFISVGAAWWIGQALENPAAGFFCIAGFYLLVAIVVLMNKEKWIKLPIINALLKKINIHEES